MNESKRRIVDCFLYYNEMEMLEYRLKVLWDVVDFFVISESAYSFMGKPKTFLDFTNSRLFKYLSKIIVVRINVFPFFSPDTTKNEQWNNENYQRDSLMDGIDYLIRNKKQLDDRDIIVLSDVDEIPDPETLRVLSYTKNGVDNCFIILKQKYYCYNITTIRDFDWYHVKAFTYKSWQHMLQSQNLSVIRLYGVTDKMPSFITNYKIFVYGGWHLSYFGNVEFIRNKILNFSHQEYNFSDNTDESTILKRMSECTDIMGRNDIKFYTLNWCTNSYLPPMFNELFFS